MDIEVQKYPNLIYPGFPKCGSNSINKHLKFHPRIAIPSGPDQINSMEVYGNDLSPRKVKNYFKHYNSFAKDKINYIEDRTDLLVYNAQAPRQIKKFFSTPPKFIVMLRDPTERSISHYFFNYKRFHDKRDLEGAFDFSGSFIGEIVKEEKEKVEKAIANNLLDLEAHSHQFLDPSVFFRYIHMSRYEKHLSNFFNHFKADNFHFILIEQLENKPLETLRKTLKFLELDTDFIPDQLGKKYNQTIIPKEKGINYFIHKMVRPVFNFIYPFSQKPRFLTDIYYKLFYKDKPEPSVELISTLTPYFNRTKNWVENKLGLPVNNYWH